MVQSLVSSRRAGDMLVEFREDSLQVGVVEVTRGYRLQSQQ